MKINRKEFLAALTMAARVAPKKTPKPVLQNVVLETSGPLLLVKATNLETYFKTSVERFDSGGSEELIVLVNAQSARDIVKNLTGENVELLDVAGSLNATIGGATLVGDSPEMFPMFPDLSNTVGFDLPAVDFRGMIENVRYAAAREESRYMINGILMEVKESKLRLVGTDGRRLAIAERAAGADDGAVSAVVGMSALNALRVNIGKSKEMLHVDVADVWAQFSWGKNVLTSRLFESKFPDYACVIPKNPPIRVSDIERTALIAALKRLKPFTSGDIRMIKAETRGDVLTISAEAAGVGRDSVDIGGKINGEGAAGFNPDYMLDALKASDLDRIGFRFSDDQTPAVFDLGFTYVLMPISGS